MSFLYGNNVTKAGLARITDGTPQYGGVIVYSMSDIPLGFGVAAQPTEYCRDLEPNANVVGVIPLGQFESQSMTSMSAIYLYLVCTGSSPRRHRRIPARGGRVVLGRGNPSDVQNFIL
jgi:hypothetical protein